MPIKVLQNQITNLYLFIYLFDLVVLATIVIDFPAKLFFVVFFLNLMILKHVSVALVYSLFNLEGSTGPTT